MKTLVILAVVVSCLGCSHQRVVQGTTPPAWPHALITIDTSAFPDIPTRDAYISEVSLESGSGAQSLELGRDQKYYYFKPGNHRLTYGCSGVLKEYSTYLQVKLEAGKKYFLYCQNKEAYFRPKLVEVPNYAIKGTSE